MWAVGVVLYLMLAGALPFTAPSLVGLRDAVMRGTYTALNANDVSAPAVAMVAALLAMAPGSRPSAADVCRHPWLAERPVGHVFASPSELLACPTSRAESARPMLLEVKVDVLL